MLSTLIRTLFVCSLLFTCAAVALAQEPTFRVGDIVEAHSYFYNPPWQKAKVIEVGGGCSSYKPFKVHFLEVEDHGVPCVGADEIRALEVEQPRADGNGSAGDNNARVSGAFAVGDRVDVYPSWGRDKATRGTIIEAGGGRYKVHYDGCESYKDAVVDRGELHPAATIAADAPEIKFLVGSWKMFMPSYPNTVVRGNTIYREYGMGAQAPPLRINADGTYVWHDEFNQPPVKGRWTTDAKIEGAKYGVVFIEGVVIKDSKGVEWKKKVNSEQGTANGRQETDSEIRGQRSAERP